MGGLEKVNVNYFQYRYAKNFNVRYFNIGMLKWLTFIWLVPWHRLLRCYDWKGCNINIESMRDNDNLLESVANCSLIPCDRSVYTAMRNITTFCMFPFWKLAAVKEISSSSANSLTSFVIGISGSCLKIFSGVHEINFYRNNAPTGSFDACSCRTRGQGIALRETITCVNSRGFVTWAARIELMVIERLRFLNVTPGLQKRMFPFLSWCIKLYDARSQIRECEKFTRKTGASEFEMWICFKCNGDANPELARVPRKARKVGQLRIRRPPCI